MDRRQLITGLISLVAAPAIVRVSSIMPVRVIRPTLIRTHMVITAIITPEFCVAYNGFGVGLAYEGVLRVAPLKGEIKIGDIIHVDDTGRAYA